MSQPQSVPLRLPARILLLGSGELGKELTISLQRLGCHVIAVDSYPNAPAMQVADECRVLAMSDEDELRSLLDEVSVDLVVPEIEAIATQELARSQNEGSVRVVPNAFAVQATMDRQRIRSLAASLDGVATSKYRFASSADEIRQALDHTGLPAFIKPTMSSSGHGQSRITDVGQVDEAFARASEGARHNTGRVIVEESIDFDSEITLLTIRWWDEHSGCVRTDFCDPIGHRQEDGDYVESWQPAAISPAALDKCQIMAAQVTQALAEADGQDPASTLGLFGVEFFIKGDDAWFSELSPRPHDTGMVTMATQDLSEFDLHARAILGLPLHTQLRRPGASAVIKSREPVDDPEYTGVAQAMRTGDVRIFNKPVSRAGRRVGVVLANETTAQEARSVASSAAALIGIREREHVASLDHE
ncbi:formate-dependent phosphoribosylglycinamide formyltransferase [Schaalia sp. ZJ1691]|uniref:formate-dependent phosphoribosylglycinamide formyltransferase n=1 Tax=Schaalia sp. ZJ1691 TaxID=2709404 RepID=UPI0013ED24BF|nr:formate-dependent phosphoribosylglycinamide formyltransferase [Schaalia sp. ZJ1691]